MATPRKKPVVRRDKPADKIEIPSEEEFLKLQFDRADRDYREAKAGSQASVAAARALREIHQRLMELQRQETPTGELDAIEVLELCAKYAPLLPEPVLAVFANEWAGRHRVKWIAAERLEDSKEGNNEGPEGSGVL